MADGKWCPQCGDEIVNLDAVLCVDCAYVANASADTVVALRTRLAAAERERDALRAAAARPDAVARQVQVARMALADIAEGRAEVQCLAGGPAEPGRHCYVHDGARGCHACQAADVVARLRAVAEAARAIWTYPDRDAVDARIARALAALDGGRDG